MKDVKIVIYTTGYWRSYFLKELFKKFAEIEIVNMRVDTNFKKQADFYLWERQIGKAPFSFIDLSKLFIYDYEAEGNRDKLVRFAKKFNISNPRFLLLLPNKKDVDTFPLQLPPPAKFKKKYLFTPPKLCDRNKDTFFIGAPTYIVSEKKNQQLPFTVFENNCCFYNQRLEWATKLSEAQMLSNGEGIVKKKKLPSPDKIVKLFGNHDFPFVKPLTKNVFFQIY